MFTVSVLFFQADILLYKNPYCMINFMKNLEAVRFSYKIFDKTKESNEKEISVNNKKKLWNKFHCTLGNMRKLNGWRYRKFLIKNLIS